MALNISRGIISKAQKICVYGPEGIGKSSFAADFPEPLFIDTEGSTNLMNVARLSRPTSWTMLINQIREVKTTPGCCQTLIIDTIDWAEQLCVEHVCSVHNKKGVEDFGYGNGYVYVKEEFGRLLNLLQDVIDVGINVVLTAHTQIRKFEQPDEAGSYDRYELKLGKKTSSQTAPLVKEWADMVLFANYKTIVVTVDKKKKAQGGERVMHTVHHPSWDAKNRHDLAEELPLAYSSIAACIPTGPAKQPEPAPQVAAATTVVPHQTPDPVPDPKQDDRIAKHDMYFYHPESESYWILKKGDSIDADIDATLSHEVTKEEYERGIEEKAVADEAEAVEARNHEQEDIPRALADLMSTNQVFVSEIKQVVASKGYYPLDTPITNYDPGFIDGVLVGAWEQVFEAIKENREVPFK